MIALLIMGTIATATTIIAIVEEDQKKYKVAKQKEREDKAELHKQQLAVNGYYTILHQKLNIVKNRYNIDRETISQDLKDEIFSYENENNFGTNCALDYEQTGQMSPICLKKGITEEKVNKAKALNKKEEEEKRKQKTKVIYSVLVFVILIIILISYKDEIRKIL